MDSGRGFSAAGGAVAIYLNHDYVTVLERSTSSGGKIRCIFVVGRHKHNTTLMQLFLLKRNTIRCLTNTTRWPALKEHLLYLGDDLIHNRLPFCNSSYWELSFTILQSAIAVVTHLLNACSESTLKPPVPRVIGTRTLAPTYRHWEIRSGNIGTMSYADTDLDAWICHGLNGNGRWMQKVDITLSHQFQGYLVVNGNLLRNTDTIEGSKRDSKPKRRDQDLWLIRAKKSHEGFRVS